MHGSSIVIEGVKSRDNAGALQGKYSKTMQKNRTAACAKANQVTAA